MVDRDDAGRNYRGIYPGVFTMGNLFCGFMSILASFEGDATQAAWFIFLGFFLDGLDGFVARATRGQTRFGVELDSLTDMVTFGLAPAVMIYSLKLKDFGKWGWILGFVFVMCGAFRLARYNVNATAEKSSTYTGLPIPAAASILASYTIFCYHIWGEFVWPKLLVSLVIGCSFLMVSAIQFEGRPYTFRTTRDRVKFAYIAISIVALIVAPRTMFFPLAFIYVVSGPARELFLTIRAGFGLGRRVLRGSEDSPRGVRRRRKAAQADPHLENPPNVQDAASRPPVELPRREPPEDRRPDGSAGGGRG